MKRGRVQIMILGLVIALGSVWCLSPVAVADAAGLIAVPPFKGKTSSPALLTGLQQVLIDDLQELLEKPVMTRAEMLSFLAQMGKGRGSTLYITEVPTFSTALNSRYVLINEWREHDGRVAWQVKLLKGTTGVLEHAWKFEGSLDRLWHVKQQVMLAIRQALAGPARKDAVRTPLEEVEGKLSALMAFARGLEALDSQDYATAVRHLRQALQYDATFRYATKQLEVVRAKAQDHLTSPRDLGLFLLADEQPESAEGYLQVALRQHDRDGEVLHALSQIALARKQLKAARQHALKARESDGRNARPWIMLGKISQAEGKDREAQQMFQKARDLAPSNPELRQSLAELSTKVGEKDTAQVEYVKAAALYTEEFRLEEANRVLTEAEKIAPQAANRMVAEGNLALRVGQSQEALRAYEQAKAVEPESAPIWRQIGRIYQQQGAVQAAQEQYQQAISLNAHDFEAHLEMGRLHLEAEQYDSAAPYLQKAKQLQPDQVEVKKMLGQVYASLGKRDLALQEYRSLLQESDDDAESYKAYGDVLLETGNVAQAELQYAKAVKLDPDFSPAYTLLGKARQTLGKTAEAAVAFKQARLLDAARTPEEQEQPGIKSGLVQLIESFPEIRHGDEVVTVALLPLDVLLEKKSLIKTIFANILGFIKMRKTTLKNIENEFIQAMQKKYPNISLASREKFLSSKLYRSLGPEGLNDAKYLSELCDFLDVHAIIFYQIVNKGVLDNKYHIVVKEWLFEKLRSALWTNETNLVYAKKDIEYINILFLIPLSGIPLFAIVYFSIYVKQGFGSLVVSIEQAQSRNKSFFSILLSKNDSKDLTKTKKNLMKIVQSSPKTGRYEREVRHGVYERSMVFNETTFKKVHVGTYSVYLFGVITDMEGNDVGNYQTTQKVTIEKDQVHKLVFDLRPHTTRVNIHVLHGQAVAQGAEVSIREERQSRYVKDAMGTSFQLPVGKYTLLIQYEGKLFTEEVAIPTLEKNFDFTFTLPTNA